MHEYSLAISILDIVMQQVRTFRPVSVRQVNLCLGEYAGVEACTLESCFELVTQGTPADGAHLLVEKIPVAGVCNACGTVAVKRGRLLRCPVCEKSSVTLSAGREFYVKSIEVE